MQHPLHQHQRLHHRSNTHRTTAASGQSLTKSWAQHDAINPKPHPRPSGPIKDSIKKYLKLLIISTTLFSLLVYGWALICFDWPPNGHPADSFDPSQGDWWISPNLTSAFRHMLVVAHPDDESLFFSPTLINLASPRLVIPIEFNSTRSTENSTQLSPMHSLNSHIPMVEIPSGHILCLSSGNADGLGFKRTKEMKASCREFKIPSSQCIIIDDPDLPDSMSVWWAEEKIAEYVKFYVDLWDIDVVITFDHHGVSSHANHRAIAAAVKGLVETEPTFPMTFMLRSSSLVEKYSWLLSLPISLYKHHLHLNHEVIIPNDSSAMTNKRSQLRRISKSKFTSSQHSLILSSPRKYLDGRRSFSQHVSQNVWFRRLWLIFRQDRVAPFAWPWMNFADINDS